MGSSTLLCNLLILHLCINNIFVLALSPFLLNLCKSSILSIYTVSVAVALNFVIFPPVAPRFVSLASLLYVTSLAAFFASCQHEFSYLTETRNLVSNYPIHLKQLSGFCLFLITIPPVLIWYFLWLMAYVSKLWVPSVAQPEGGKSPTCQAKMYYFHERKRKLEISELSDWLSTPLIS